jgi:hypothetical protein
VLLPPGILADQMGLGKTVQTVAFLAYLRCQGTLGPHLIIGPLSTLANWVNEVKRWVPSMPVVLYHGDKKARAALRAQHMPRGEGGREGEGGRARRGQGVRGRGDMVVHMSNMCVAAASLGPMYLRNAPSYCTSLLSHPPQLP